jgi:uncharacterized protein
MNRCVLDTNVIVSALLLEGSKSATAFDAAFQKGIVLVSVPLLEEVAEVLSRNKFDSYMLREERERFLIGAAPKAQFK